MDLTGDVRGISVSADSRMIGAGSASRGVVVSIDGGPASTVQFRGVSLLPSPPSFGPRKALLHENACKIEHSLNPEVTDKICTFLNHPKTCPHGDPIPRGVCCLGKSGIRN